ncbi:hypothetical protein PYCCODRAFT_1438740 [Trametes coccinea BRFM310]|uniref:Uncharacterized protein n=1 Tax=Trametes coccinea (strain BRFM310) TaxID=1353009 RepID=A0A1Y2ICQ5_TRAC3|nr:hypothetical protein PYCCODRAFT_1438740 [Trametes coccinea BRFM310]
MPSTANHLTSLPSAFGPRRMPWRHHGGNRVLVPESLSHFALEPSYIFHTRTLLGFSVQNAAIEASTLQALFALHSTLTSLLTNHLRDSRCRGSNCGVAIVRRAESSMSLRELRHSMWSNRRSTSEEYYVVTRTGSEMQMESTLPQQGVNLMSYVSTMRTGAGHTQGPP